MPDPQVSIHLVTWNSMTHLPSCLPALVQQTYPATRLLVIDNGSIDSTVAWLAAEYPQVNVLRNTRNLGFSRGHNQAIRLTDSPYILCLNPDVVLTPTWVAQAVAWMERHPEVGVIGGKLLRFTYTTDELKEVLPSAIIDSAGLRVYRSRHTVERGSGLTDEHQFDRPEAVFGISGACLLFRRAALESIRFQNEYFDEDFFAYKEDVDLARRFLRQSWTCWYDPAMIAYHHRSIKSRDTTTNVGIARNYRHRELFNSRNSYRNHWLIFFKHETPRSFWPDAPWILWYELRKAGFLLVTHPSTLSGLLSALRLYRRMRKKATFINRHSKVPAQQIRNWTTHA